MTVPTKRKLHRVVLEIAAESGQGMSQREVVESVTGMLSLTDKDLTQQTSSGVLRVPLRFQQLCPPNG